MRALLPQVCYFLVPLLGSALAHGIVLKWNLVTFLARPIDAGHTFRGKRLFGPNKTFRGIVVPALGSMAVFLVQARFLHAMDGFRAAELFDYSQVSGILFGFAFGAFAMLAELPNSFAKRQVGIESGSAGKGLALPVFYVLDQIDLLVGIWLAVALFAGWVFSVEAVVISFALVFVGHQLITLIGYFLGMRKTIR